MDVSQRTIEEMKPVVMDPESIKNGGAAYTVRRNLEILSGKIRYDKTFLSPKKLGNEFMKTFGHYHKDNAPELYEVLEGRAYFLLQKYGSNKVAEIKEAYIVEANAGEKAIMPPRYGHLSINIGEQDLILGNWIGLTDYDYTTFAKLRGGCYYILDKNSKIEFEKNKNYKSVPELKKLKLKDIPEFGIKNDARHPILDFKNPPDGGPKKLDWLVNPQKYMELLTIENLYREI